MSRIRNMGQTRRERWESLGRGGKTGKWAEIRIYISLRLNTPTCSLHQKLLPK